MGYKYTFRNIKGKNQLTSYLRQLYDCWYALIPNRDSLVAKAYQKLVQQSRALYRTSVAKVKRQKENGANWSKRPVLAFALILSSSWTETRY